MRNFKTMRIVYFSVLFLLLLSACNKKEGPVVKKVSGDRIKQQYITVQNASSINRYTTFFEYDLSGRLIKQSTSTGNSRVEYIYRPNSVEEKSFDDNGVQTGSTVYDLDANGLATRAVNHLGATTTYEYNSSGYMIKRLSSYNGSATSHLYFYSAGNVLDSARLNVTGASASTQLIIYEGYLMDRRLTTGSTEIGLSWLGEYFISPYTKSTIIDSFNPAPQIRNYSYEFDGSGRIIKSVNSSVSPQVTITTEYTYL